MNIPKDLIIKELEKQGRSEKAQQLLKELPAEIDHEKHAELLKQHGIDPGALLAKVAQQGLDRL